MAGLFYFRTYCVEGSHTLLWLNSYFKGKVKVVDCVNQVRGAAGDYLWDDQIIG